MDSSKAPNRSALPPFERLAHSTALDHDFCSISGFQGSFEPISMQHPALLSRHAEESAAGSKRICASGLHANAG